MIVRRSSSAAKSFVLVGCGEHLALGQQGLEADADLKRRLAHAARVEVGAGADQQQLARGDRGLAAQHLGDPFLRPQELAAAAALASAAPRLPR